MTGYSTTHLALALGTDRSGAARWARSTLCKPAVGTGRAMPIAVSDLIVARGFRDWFGRIRGGDKSNPATMRVARVFGACGPALLDEQPGTLYLIYTDGRLRCGYTAEDVLAALDAGPVHYLNVKKARTELTLEGIL